MALNRTLKIAIIDSGKPQTEIAELARINDSRLSKIVRGKENPSESEMLRLAGVLQRPVAELFPGVAA